MKTTIRAFQREFPGMRKLAAAGKTVIIEAGGPLSFAPVVKGPVFWAA